MDQNNSNQNISDKKFLELIFLTLKFPSKIIKSITTEGDAPYVYRFAFINGAINGIYRFKTDLYDEGLIAAVSIFLSVFILIVFFFAGGFGNILTVFISGWFLKLGSNLFKGRIDNRQARAITAYASIPEGVLSILVLLLIVLNIFLLNPILVIISTILLISGLSWSLVLLVWGVKVINKFSIIKAILSTIIIPLIIFSVFGVIALFFYLISLIF